MKGIRVLKYSVGGSILMTLVACSISESSCDDLIGTVTHRTTEITGIDTIAIERQIPSSAVIEAVDQFNGTEFSNLRIRIDLSWIEEQHRFNAPSTFIQSLVDLMMPIAAACTLAPPPDDFQPAVAGIRLFSDTDLNNDLIAGQDLSHLFSISNHLDNNETILEAVESGSLVSSRTYRLQPAFRDSALISIPSTPNTHVFTISVQIDDGREFEIRSPEFLISGV